LNKSTGWDLLEGGESTWNGGEGLSAEVNCAWKTDSVATRWKENFRAKSKNFKYRDHISSHDVPGLGDKVSNNSKHGNASVLEFNSTEAVELLLVTISDEAQRIEKAEWCLGTQLVLKSLDSRAGGLLAGRGKGGSGGTKGGGNGELHFALLVLGIV
jgi:hypothetical protein